MKTLVEASFDSLLKESLNTADFYLSGAIRHIDKYLGDGYAKKNPELIASFMKVAANDFNVASFAKVLENSLESIAESLPSTT